MWDLTFLICYSRVKKKRTGAGVRERKKEKNTIDALRSVINAVPWLAGHTTTNHGWPASIKKKPPPFSLSLYPFLSWL